MGVDMGTALLGTAAAVLLALRARPAAAITAGYWVTVVAVRAAGTTLGDCGSHSFGLELGTFCSGAVFVACYVLLPRSPAAVRAPLGAGSVWHDDRPTSAPRRPTRGGAAPGEEGKRISVPAEKPRHSCRSLSRSVPGA